MLEKTFSPKDIESRQYARSEAAGAFKPKGNGTPYCIMMPPPNVTGSLHIGHGLTMTIQDILVRYHRMLGDDVLWQPGTDHAGIATQMVVERELAKEGLTRQQLGREKFLERVWQWKEQSGGTILEQLRRLGASADWSRARFTMDDGLSAAVRKVFVDLYQQGLIYKDTRLVNWDTKFQTAISDLEVQAVDTQGAYYHIAYPLVNGGHITVATTRPETLFGDAAVAVHPEHPTLAQYIGQQVRLPLTDRTIPIIADSYADPEKGTGAVKITPAHDFNDFEVGKRHNLEQINILNRDGTLNDQVPAAYQGMDRLKARPLVVKALEQAGLLVKVEPVTHTVPMGDRSNSVIEPYLTEQWFVKADTLAAPALEAVRTGISRFVPENWQATYFHWLENIQPWCISRQLWWGHRIPAWYAPDGQCFVAENADAAHEQAFTRFGKHVDLQQDNDVLDTWFSSGLWPFSTLGWPEHTPALAQFYPNTVLVTGFDIIFFWVARMLMLGIHCMGGVPFKDIYIHALVRDEHGQKMSKSKGNVIDPLEVIDQYGADALRFTMAIMAAQGRDVKLSLARVEGYRNFATKLWNASRFAEMNGARLDPAYDPRLSTTALHVWLYDAIQQTAITVTAALDAYKFNEAAEALYHCLWNTFCDWYIEFAKVSLNGNDADAKAETQAMLGWALDQLTRLLHPFMPFITDELAQNMGFNNQPLTLATWPMLAALADQQASRDMAFVQELITQVRALKAEMNIAPGAMLVASIKQADTDAQRVLQQQEALLLRMARLSRIDQDAEAGGMAVVVVGCTLILQVGAVLDVAKEQARLDKETVAIIAEMQQLDSKLSNDNFVARAPAHVVEEYRNRKEELTLKQGKIRETLARLGSLAG